jgi:hypothetical protein
VNAKRHFFNGLDGATGRYLLSPMTSRDMVSLGRRVRVEACPQQPRAQEDASRDPVFDCDPRNLAEMGWGVVFAPGTPDQVRQALAPLLAHRREQAGACRGSYYRECEYVAGEGAAQFLTRQGAKYSSCADADRFPYYLLLVGDPEAIPFSFQTELDVNYGVGRLCFESLASYRRYAASVVDAETGKRRPTLPRQAAFFGVRNEGDQATGQTADELVTPLADTVVGNKEKGWDLCAYLGPRADKARLSRLLGGGDTPALLFSASHGVGFPPQDHRQLERQGALVCQDWPGPGDEAGVDREQYFAAGDLSRDAGLHGLIAFLFACYSVGTPRRDNFAPGALGKPPEIAPRAFVSPLPQCLLGHPNGGALAVIGHVDRAWTTSFDGSAQGEGVDIFRNTLRRLLAGHTVGWAMEYFNQAYAVMAAELARLWEAQHAWEDVDPAWFSALWMAHNDARNFVVFGDPAVRLAA